MSYDILVFEPHAAPRPRDEFLAWYEHITQWSEDHTYNDAAVTSASLASWFHDFSTEWVPLNGPHSPLKDLADDDPLYASNQITEYSIGKSAIYCCFRWSAAQKARESIVRTAKKHNVGFYYPSERDGMIVFPDQPL